jgi:hypothetical protein
MQWSLIKTPNKDRTYGTSRWVKPHTTWAVPSTFAYQRSSVGKAGQAIPHRSPPAFGQVRTPFPRQDSLIPSLTQSLLLRCPIPVGHDDYQSHLIN